MVRAGFPERVYPSFDVYFLHEVLYHVLCALRARMSAKANACAGVARVFHTSRPESRQQLDMKAVHLGQSGCLRGFQMYTPRFEPFQDVARDQRLLPRSTKVAGKPEPEKVL